MTYKFGRTSTARLNTCDEDIQTLFRHIVQEYDCSIICGHRTRDDQQRAFSSQRSKVQWPNSKHNTSPSIAVDVAPYPIDWGEKGSAQKRKKAIARFYHFAGYVLAMSKELGIKVRWGGDWDGDNDFSDQNFDDLVHWELKNVK